MQRRFLKSALLRGAIAGLMGTVPLACFELVERRILGTLPPFAPRRIVRRLTNGKVARSTPEAWAAHGARSVYGALLGVAFAAARRRLPSSTVGAGLVVGCSIAAFELVALPTIGATRPVRTWTRLDRLLLGTQTALFGVTLSAAYESSRN